MAALFGKCCVTRPSTTCQAVAWNAGGGCVCVRRVLESEADEIKREREGSGGRACKLRARCSRGLARRQNQRVKKKPSPS